MATPSNYTFAHYQAFGLSRTNPEAKWIVESKTPVEWPTKFSQVAAYKFRAHAEIHAAYDVRAGYIVRMEEREESHERDSRLPEDSA